MRGTRAPESERCLRRLARFLATFVLISISLACSDSRPSVLLISIDTLRADRLGCFGHEPARTPHLDQLARDGVLFLDAQAPAPLTLPSHTTLMTGQDPYDHGVHDNGLFVVPASARTLAERLRAAEYWTGAVIGAYPLVRRFGLEQGFRTYDDRLATSTANTGEIVERPAAEVTDRTIALLKKADEAGEPFFLWAHYFDPHFPYEAPESYRRGGADPYDAEIAYADAEIGRLLKSLEELGRRDDTLVVITADHGESLGEHGEPTHGTFAYNATLHVPWLMRWPGTIPSGLEVNRMVRLQDVAPTILDMIGIERDADLGGASVRPLLGAPDRSTERIGYCETFAPEFSFGWSKIVGLRTERHRFLLSPHPELYDIRKDPDELEDIAEQEPDQVRAFLKRLERIREASARTIAAGQIGRPDFTSLAALGYTSRPRDITPWVDETLPSASKRAHLLESFSELERWTAGGRTERALPLAREVLAEDPDNSHVREILAFNLQGAGEIEEAITEYERAIALNPRNPFLYNTIAKLCADRGNTERARRWLAAGLQAAPDEPSLAMGLAQMQFMEGEKEAALETLTEAVDRSPSDASLRLTLAGVYLRLKRPQEARREVERVLDRDPENAQAIQMQRRLGSGR